MNENFKGLLYFLGGVAVGALGVVALSKNKLELKPALTDLAAGAMDLKEKVACVVERAKEDVSDFMAEVEHARHANKGCAKSDEKTAA